MKVVLRVVRTVVRWVRKKDLMDLKLAVLMADL